MNECKQFIWISNSVQIICGWIKFRDCSNNGTNPHQKGDNHKNVKIGYGYYKFSSQELLKYRKEWNSL
jgi:hypothetical protein